MVPQVRTSRAKIKVAAGLSSEGKALGESLLSSTSRLLAELISLYLEA